jgi:hypothetical protein
MPFARNRQTFYPNIKNIVYNTDGSIQSATIDGVAYSFTYLFGKISKVTGGGITKTYTWANGRLASMVVS